MFAKRVRTLREMRNERDILCKKLQREVSKINSNIEIEINKVLKKRNLHPEFKRIELEDVSYNSRVPLRVQINFVNNKMAHKDNIWVVSSDSEYGFVECPFVITVDEFEDICNQLSEKLGVEVVLYKVSVNYEPASIKH